MKVLDLLNYSASFYDKDYSKKIKELAEIIELDLNRKIEDLSYRNKKKVGIVQRLLDQPKFIILDEPIFELFVGNPEINDLLNSMPQRYLVHSGCMN